MDNREVNATISLLKSKAAWPELKDFLLSCIGEYPDEYFFHTELSSTYYSLERFKESLISAETAMRLKGGEDDVWVNYHYGMALAANDKNTEALAQFEKICRKRVTTIAYNVHGEGLKSAESLKNDATYMIGVIHMELGNYAKAKKYMALHLSHRKRGLYSDFTKQQVLARYHKLT